MIGRPAGSCGLHAAKPEFTKIKRVHKGIDDANRIALVHPIVETLGQQSGLPAIRSRNETLH